MGFIHPFALLAVPLALVPLWLAWRGRRTGEPVRFSSLYLVERARRNPARRAPARGRWVAILRALAVLLLVLAATRPTGCGGGDPASHLPTRAVVAVDVSASVGQRESGRAAWEAIRAAADTLLAAGSPDDRLALAAVADGIVGWWEGSPSALRRQLAALEPTARASDWPRALSALADRSTEGTETYLITDGSRGAVPPGPAPAAAGWRKVWRPSVEGGGNRALEGAAWAGPGAVSLSGRAWGDAPRVAEAGRARGGAVTEARPLPLDGTLGSGTWPVADTATFALRPSDRLPSDDRLFVAAGGDPEPYDIVRWAPADEPADPGPLFWEAALASLPRGARVGRVATLGDLAARQPDLALLPIRRYRADEAALLADLARGGTRLLFSPECARPVCAPPSGWLPAPDLAVPDLEWAERVGGAALLARPGGRTVPAVPEPLLDRAPVRGGLVSRGGAAPDWRWDVATGEAALWVRERVAIWLPPLGPPVTRLGTTPVFPLVADATLAAWDPRWSAGPAGTRVGEPLPVPPGGATVEGPLGVGAGRRTRWRVAPGGRGPSPDRPGFYRVRGDGGSAIFRAVNGAPGEGDLTPLSESEWRAAWGPVIPPAGWRVAIFPRRRGPELWPWALVLATLALVAEAVVRRARFDK